MSLSKSTFFRWCSVPGGTWLVGICDNIERCMFIINYAFRYVCTVNSSLRFPFPCAFSLGALSCLLQVSGPTIISIAQSSLVNVVELMATSSEEGPF